MSASQDGSESVDQFLARIASVKEGRDQASEERTRRLEEDFLKNRKERQARRLERARSLSPSKTGPSMSSAVSHTPAATRDAALNPPVDFSPRTSTLSRSNAVSARTSPKLEPKRLEQEPVSVSQSGPTAQHNAAGLARSGTLSWQQRPPRDGGVSRPRPLSSIETVRPISRAGETDNDLPEPTRQEIAASLGMKDPTWFRQTQDRAIASAAFRKNQVEDNNIVEHSKGSSQLPGLTRDGTRSASRTPGPESRSATPTHARQLSPMLDHKAVRELSPTPVMSSDAPKLEPSPQQPLRGEVQIESTPNSVNRSGSVLAGRPASPTKGLGGFVESAMMKRSDSISKRWSVQANAGLKRGDSVAGVRPLSGVRSLHAPSMSRGNTRDTSPSPLPVSRPESRDGVTEDSSRSATPDRGKDTIQTPQNHHELAKTLAVGRPQTPTDEYLSRSPLKDVDTKRWSPTKSSWLESALLSKPETPKLQPAREEVPAWKASLQRNKASRDLSPDKIKMTASVLRKDTDQDSETTAGPPPVSKKPELKPRNASATRADPASKEREAASEESAIKLVVPQKSSNTPSTVSTPNVSGSPGSGLMSVNRPATDVTKAPTVEKTERKPPLVVRPKPQTPPKVDFRATLKSRVPLSSEEKGAEPEFRSIFGKLKPTQTQNYVAPDTLKTNIMSGKAALSTTNGPQKTQRVDEFKESILQKKEAMKTGTVQKKESPVPELQSAKPAPIIPEALARRKTLNKAPAAVEKLRNAANTTQSTVQAQSKPPVTVNPKPSTLSSSAAPAKNVIEKTSATKAQILESTPSNEGKTSASSSGRPAIVSKAEGAARPTAESKETRTETQAPDMVSVSPISIIPSKAELPIGSKLASRMNPNLAVLLSRGGSPRPSPTQSPSPERRPGDTFPIIAKPSASDEPTATGELTHMTKGRAKGPKRRAPKAQAAPAMVSVESEPTRKSSQETRSVEPVATTSPVKSFGTLRNTFAAQPVFPKTQHERSLPATSPVSSPGDESEMKSPVAGAKQKPNIATKSPELRRISSTLSSRQAEEPESKMPPTKQFEIVPDADAVGKSNDRPPIRELPKPPKPATIPTPLTPSKSRINTSKPAPSFTDLPAKPQSPKPATSARSLPVKSGAIVSEPTATPGRPTKPSTLAKPAKSGQSDVHLAPLLSAYFPIQLEKHQRADFDAHGLLLDAQKPEDKIKTIAHTIQEVNGDGKKSAMPPQQEHILFEEHMYLVTHSFEGSTGGKTAEVYLWCGDGVADAAVEDAQLFCKRDARDHNARLEVVKQGKESSKFFQALGGILITRRSKSSSLYMLRGRRHLGHIAFDEVELSTSNLCSGFTHLVSAKFGKLYLWKGTGSGADEVGCARLIGMDIGLTGEIEEVVETEEPVSFWESFPERSRKGSWSPSWSSRAENQYHPTTLYKVDYERPKATTGGFWGLRAASPPKTSNRIAVESISHFCSRDIEPTDIYVVDGYSSIYVLFHPQAVGKSAEVITAMDLAQELAMLAPSVQDRSLIPSCYVVFGEPPPDVKVCFRKWDDSRAVKSNLPSACVPLQDVMEALEV